MGRYTGWLFAAILTLVPIGAQASPRFATPPDVRATVVMRLFGETSDARSSLATSGASFSDSPLREAAFVVGIQSTAPHRQSRAIAQRARAGSDGASLTYVVPHLAYLAASEAVNAAPAQTSTAFYGTVTSAYEAAPAPLFSADPNSSTFSFSGSTSNAASSFASQSALDEAMGAGSSLDSNLRVPLGVRVGNFRMIAGFSAGLASTPSSGIENTLPVFVPSYAGVSRSSVGANLAVPVTPRLFLGLGYNTERLVTGYGLPSALDGLDGRNEMYSGNVTFLFPRLSTALSLSAQQYRYQDNVMPAEFTQLRENVNLTVKL